MRIGFYGCANNYPFMLARACQRLGHEVRFIVSSRERLNRPEGRYSDIPTPYPPWIVDASHRFRWHALVPGLGRAAILAELNACDVAILNEEGPALARHLQVPHAVLLTGSDIEVFADPAKAHTLKSQAFHGCSPRLRRIFSSLVPTALIRHGLTEPQRAGMRSAQTVVSCLRGLAPGTDRLLDELGIIARQRLELQFTDTDDTPYCPSPVNSVLRIFSAARFTWRPMPEEGLTSLDLKGSDIMVRGLAKFVRQTGRPLDIHFVKKGRHVGEIVALTEALGLAGQITWHEEMGQNEVLTMYRRADIVFDQLGGSIIGLAGLDAMATGRPLIANGRPEFIESSVGEASPVCQARTVEEVCGQLERLTGSAAERSRTGIASRRYVEKHFSADAAAKRLIATLPGGAKFNSPALAPIASRQ